MSETVLSLKNVTIYQDKNPVLSDVNIDVNHGEFLYLLVEPVLEKVVF
jgi:cell division transport system ATP-binding protein